MTASSYLGQLIPRACLGDICLPSREFFILDLNVDGCESKLFHKTAEDLKIVGNHDLDSPRHRSRLEYSKNDKYGEEPRNS